MARKKRIEFKPDSAGATLLGRLYLTQRQRKNLLKWFLYAFFCLALSVVQDVICSRLSIFGATTDLLPCAILLICMLQGPEAGGTFALITTVFYYFSGAAPGVYVILLLPLLGILATIFRQAFLRDGFNSTMFGAGVAVLLYEAVVFVMGIVMGQTLIARIPVSTAAAVICLITLPVMYPVIRAIAKIGGKSWKE